MKKFLKYIVFVIIILLIVYFVRKLQNNCNDFESINEAIDTEITSKIQEIKDIKDSNCVSIAFMTDLHINNQEERICTNNIKAFTNISNSKLVDLPEFKVIKGKLKNNSTFILCHLPFFFISNS